MPQWMVGIDTGGTFTDLIAVERETRQMRLAKVPSSGGDPSEAVRRALDRLFATGVAPGEVTLLVHGTTVATNALLEGEGAKVGLLITKGFRAVYEARGWSQPKGADLLDTHYRKPPLLVPQRLTEEVDERLDYRGEVLTPIDEAGLRRSVRRLKDQGVEAIAVCFLFSFLNPAHERAAARIVAEEAPGCRLSLSSTVLPVIREYPRLSTTVIDAYVGPRIERYLVRLEARLKEAGITSPQLFLMQSNGGLMRISIGARHPNQTLLSGPAAGVVAGTALAALAQRRNVVTFDMGGTSTDISVIADGRVLETTEGEIAGQDIGTPMLKVRTLGAGGGTIAAIGKDGLLKVGPRSAGAEPGPACYGKGGTEPTVTDANLVLGALSSETLLAGSMRLDEGAARRALDERIGKPLGLDAVGAAKGILRIVNTQMAVDLRLALQEQGQDPRKFALVAFGGAGPLHAAYLARSVGIPTVLVPPYPGINCAMGMLQTAVRHSYLRSEVGVLSRFPAARMQELFAALERDALAEAQEEGFAPDQVRLTRLVDLRYPHQGYTLAVECKPGLASDDDKAALKRDFDALHGRVYGQSAPREDAEIVTFRLQSEIDVPQLELPRLDPGDGNAARALTGERRLYDIESDGSFTARIYDRAKLKPGDRVIGPAVIEQFDATTLVLSGHAATVDPFGIIAIEAI
ncbi:MAG TPA: hydantoinase/oxoprolinase family protein [Stellaceae bacterium]|nr:hydantoinase/oxoprolinase family protein [Stellaceae bacterium]